MITSVQNNISSIEQLQFMNMPNLEDLRLGNDLGKSDSNHITKVSALNKCVWNNLKLLELCKIHLTYLQPTIFSAVLSLTDSKYSP